ncbi:hypothetical protein [Saccharothrix tamanrassetensis]|uniref:hypothetical protein n=1 Tax=Saccharothrix tamanrassetensis TaxID=1051531 RepID=UPI00161E7EC1|nr:hypothetical protein [Saccharothrix tamanrassetensis]
MALARMTDAMRNARGSRAPSPTGSATSAAAVRTRSSSGRAVRSAAPTSSTASSCGGTSSSNSRAGRSAGTCRLVTSTRCRGSPGSSGRTWSSVDALSSRISAGPSRGRHR